jgi:hypothetical protein
MFMGVFVRIKQGCFTLEDSLQRKDWKFEELIAHIHKSNSIANYKEDPQ